MQRNNKVTEGNVYRRNKVEKSMYSDQEIKKLAEQLVMPCNPRKDGIDRDSTYGKMIIVGLYLYLHLGELQEIRVRDLDFTHGFVHISRQYDETTGEIKEPRYNLRRSVPIAKEVWDILEDQTRGKGQDDLLFSSRTFMNATSGIDDNHVKANTLRDYLYHVEDYIELEHHTMRDLRMDGIYLFIRRGISARYISMFAGYKDISYTMKRFFRRSYGIDERVVSQITGRKCERYNDFI